MIKKVFFLTKTYQKIFLSDLFAPIQGTEMFKRLQSQQQQHNASHLSIESGKSYNFYRIKIHFYFSKPLPSYKFGILRSIRSYKWQYPTFRPARD
jgi:hypothetical protein